MNDIEGVRTSGEMNAKREENKARNQKTQVVQKVRVCDGKQKHTVLIQIVIHTIFHIG